MTFLIAALKSWDIGAVAGYRTTYKLPWFSQPPSCEEIVPPEYDKEKEKEASGDCLE